MILIRHLHISLFLFAWLSIGSTTRFLAADEVGPLPPGGSRQADATSPLTPPAGEEAPISTLPKPEPAPGWMTHVFDDSVGVPWNALIIRLIVALILGLVVVGIYKGTRRASAATVTFPATLVLLCILIAMVTQVIGDNIARAFSLVGALSVVRFRTVVRDTKDTAFVIFAVVVGMASGAGQSGVAICGLIVVGAAAFLFRDGLAVISTPSREMRLVIKLVWSPELEALIQSTISKQADDIEAISAETIRQGAAMELSFKLRLRHATKVTHLVAEVARLEGIQSVELDKLKDED